MAISFFLSKSVLALELSLISPNNIEINNEFQTEINLDSEEIYDVKIFVHDSQDSGVTRDEYISQIFNTQKDIWQSSWNYLSGSYPNERKYRLKVLESPGNRQICARVRKTGADSITSKCNSISISASNIEDPIDDNNINSNDNEEKEDNENNELDDNSVNNANKINNKESKKPPQRDIEYDKIRKTS